MIEKKKVVKKVAGLKVSPVKVDPPKPDNRHPIKKFLSMPGLIIVATIIGIIGLLVMLGHWISSGTIELYSGAPITLSIAIIAVYVGIFELLYYYQIRHEVFYDFKFLELRNKDYWSAKVVCLILGVTAMILLGVAGAGLVGLGLVLYWIYQNWIIPNLENFVKILGIILLGIIIFVSNTMWGKYLRSRDREVEEDLEEEVADVEVVEESTTESVEVKNE